MNESIPETQIEDERVSAWEHIDELRDRLLRSTAAVFLLSAVAYLVRFKLWDMATRPLRLAAAARPALGDHLFAYTDLAEPFMAMMKLSFWTAVFLASPYVFYQFWAFVKPALRPREKKSAAAFVVATSGCFILGAVFAYYFMFGALADLLMDEAARAGLRPNLRPTEYLNLFLYTLVGSGVAFESPVLFYFLARFGMVNSRAMITHWREATLAILFVSGFCTPGDVIATMIIFGLALLALYFISAGVVWSVERSAARVCPPSEPREAP